METTIKKGKYKIYHILGKKIGCTTNVKKITQIDNKWVVDFNKPTKFSHYFIVKGFIAIDGVSLTITNDIEEFFSIAVIPFTWNHTIFSGYDVGSVVNLEVDMTAKYIEKIMKNSQKLEKAN